VFLFGFSFVSKSFVDILSAHDNPVCLGFDFNFFLIGKTCKMSNIQMSFIDGLFSTVLPNMGTKNLTTSSKNNMCSSVMISQSTTTFFIDFTSNFFSNIVRSRAWKRFIENMKDTWSDFDTVNNFISDSFNSKATGVVLLTS